MAQRRKYKKRGFSKREELAPFKGERIRVIGYFSTFGKVGRKPWKRASSICLIRPRFVSTVAFDDHVWIVLAEKTPIDVHLTQKDVIEVEGVVYEYVTSKGMSYSLKKGVITRVLRQNQINGQMMQIYPGLED